MSVDGWDEVNLVVKGSVVMYLSEEATRIADHAERAEILAGRGYKECAARAKWLREVERGYRLAILQLDCMP